MSNSEDIDRFFEENPRAEPRTKTRSENLKETLLNYRDASKPSFLCYRCLGSFDSLKLETVTTYLNRSLRVCGNCASELRTKGALKE